MISDWECLDRARNGDESAWKELLDRHFSKLLGLTLIVTGNPAAAQDAVQEAFVRLLRADLPHRKGQVGGLLSTIAFRLAVKEKNRSAKLTALEGVDREDVRENALQGLVREERDRYLYKAIRSLDPAYQDVLALRFYGGHSYEEIAELLSVPLGTVKSRIFYAVKQCRGILQEKGILE